MLRLLTFQIWKAKRQNGVNLIEKSMHGFFDLSCMCLDVEKTVVVKLDVDCCLLSNRPCFGHTADSELGFLLNDLK